MSRVMTSTVSRISDLLPLAVVLGVPDGPAWQRVDDLLASGRIAAGIDAVQLGVGRRDVASSFFGAWIANPVVVASAAWVLVERRSPQLSADSVHLRWHPSGWFDGIALSGNTFDVVDRDRPVDPDGAVADLPVLHRQWARRTVPLVADLLAAVEAAGSFGLPGLWGNGFVDRLYWLATELGRRTPGDPGGRVAEAQQLIDAARPLAPVRLPQARVFPVVHGGTRHLFPVKSSCCLLYKTVPPERRVPAEYCTGCPLIPDEVRGPRWTAHLEAMSRSPGFSARE